MLAAYLLLRDVSREIEVAEMRSHFVASVSHELQDTTDRDSHVRRNAGNGKSGR